MALILEWVVWLKLGMELEVKSPRFWLHPMVESRALFYPVQVISDYQPLIGDSTDMVGLLKFLPFDSFYTCLSLSGVHLF